jgi:hypothetical protein
MENLSHMIVMIMDSKFLLNDMLKFRRGPNPRRETVRNWTAIQNFFQLGQLNLGKKRRPSRVMAFIQTVHFLQVILVQPAIDALEANIQKIGNLIRPFILQIQQNALGTLPNPEVIFTLTSGQQAPQFFDMFDGIVSRPYQHNYLRHGWHFLSWR